MTIIKEKQNKTKARIPGVLIILIGGILFLSVFVIGSSLGFKLFSSADLGMRYSVIIIISYSALFIISMGYFVMRSNSELIINLSLLGTMLAFILIIDRILLLSFSEPLWIYDPILHYQHRPGYIKSFFWYGGNKAKTVKINSYGYRDDEFPRNKPQGELRGVILGDSIVMGQGVNYNNSICGQLESLLDKRDKKHKKHQIINTGVQGYSTFQEYEVLKRTIVFEPDFIAVGFCMNDVTEPYLVNSNFGGLGYDYHGVVQIRNPLFGYLLNETGLGCLAKKIVTYNTVKSQKKRGRIYSVENVIYHSNDMPEIKKAWDITLSNLDKIFRLAKEKNIPSVLLIFPYTFQFGDKTTHVSEQILIKYARKNNIDFIDFVPVFEDIIFDDPETVSYLEEKKFSAKDIRMLYNRKIRRYFLDEDHPTAWGDGIIAKKLFDYLSQKGLLDEN